MEKTAERTRNEPSPLHLRRDPFPNYHNHERAPGRSVTIPHFDVLNPGSTQQIYFNY